MTGRHRRYPTEWRIDVARHRPPSMTAGPFLIMAAALVLWATFTVLLLRPW